MVDKSASKKTSFSCTGTVRLCKTRRSTCPTWCALPCPTPTRCITLKGPISSQTFSIGCENSTTSANSHSLPTILRDSILTWSSTNFTTSWSYLTKSWMEPRSYPCPSTMMKSCSRTRCASSRCPCLLFPRRLVWPSTRQGSFHTFFNTPDHQDYVGPLCDKHYYDPQGMSIERANEFERWYDFQKELVVYCESEVLLLKGACRVFCQEFE